MNSSSYELYDEKFKLYRKGIIKANSTKINVADLPKGKYILRTLSAKGLKFHHIKIE